VKSPGRYVFLVVFGVLVVAWLTADPLGDVSWWVDVLVNLALGVPVYWLSLLLATWAERR
jgi:hypothetical protein